jgi:hypothetical protein
VEAILILFVVLSLAAVLAATAVTFGADSRDDRPVGWMGQHRA